MKHRMTAAAAILLAAILGATARAETVGETDHVLSTVYGTPPGAAKAVKVLSSPVAFKELIETTPDSAMEAKFVDGSRMTVGASARVLVDEFVFDPTKKKGNAIISIPLGTMRFVSGIMPKGSIRFETPAATIAIRGTRLKIRVVQDGSTLIAVEEGQVEVTARSGGDRAVVNAGQSIEVKASGGTGVALKTLVKPGVVAVGNAYVDLGWDAAAKSAAEAGGGASGGGDDSNLPPGNVAELKPATPELIDQISSGFGTMPGGIMITGAGALGEAKTVAYDFAANTFKVNGSLTYRPPLPAPLVRMVLQEMSAKGLPGTSITKDRAIVFGGFDPYDPIGTMLFGNDWTTGNMMKYPQYIEGYTLPSGLKTAFPKGIDPDTIVVMFDYRQRGFRIEGDKVVSRGVAVAPYFLPTVYVGGERKPQPERLGKLNGDPALQARLKAFVGDFARLKQDVTVDFVMRLTDVIGFVHAVGGSAKIDKTGMPAAPQIKTGSSVKDNGTVARRDAPKKEVRENFWGFLNEIDNPPNWSEVPDDDADMDIKGSDEELDALLNFRKAAS